MKKIIFILLCLLPLCAQGQLSTVISGTRTYVTNNITTNGVGAITGAKANAAFVGTLNGLSYIDTSVRFGAGLTLAGLQRTLDSLAAHRAAFLTSSSTLNASNLTTGTMPIARLADGSVTVAKINASGGATGRVLSWDGTWIAQSGGGGGVTTFAGLTDAGTADLPAINTPLSTALGLKANASAVSNVTNTSDANKPVSTAQAAADAAVLAAAIQRANHTGVQAISTVTGLQAAIDGKASQIALDDTAAALRADFAVTGKTFYLSKEGVPDDADLSVYSTTFGTDGTAQIQALLDQANDTTSIIIFWDTHTSVTGLRIKSNTMIIGAPGCGMILRDFSNTVMLRNETFTPITGLMHEENIHIEGLILNGNRTHSQGGADVQVLQSLAEGNHVGLGICGVKNVTVRNCKIVNTAMYAALICRVENFIFENIVADQGTAPLTLQDGVDIVGYCKNGLVRNLWVRAGDDHLVVASDGLINYNVYSEIYEGIDGDVDIIVDGVTMGGDDFGLRMFSSTHRLNATFRNFSGLSEGYSLIADNFPSNPTIFTTPGPGNFGDVLFENWSVRVGGGGPVNETEGNMSFGGHWDNLTFKNVGIQHTLGSQRAMLTFQREGLLIKNLTIDGLHQEETADSNVAYPIYFKRGIVQNANIYNSRLVRERATNASALIKVDSGATINLLNLNNNQVYGGNYVVHNEGKIDFLSAANIRHHSNDTSIASFANEGDMIRDFVLSDYFGFKQTSGSYLRTRGDAFDLGGLPDYASTGDTAENFTYTAGVLKNTAGVWETDVSASVGYGNTGLGDSSLAAGQTGRFIVQFPNDGGPGVFMLSTVATANPFTSLSGFGASIHPTTGVITQHTNTSYAATGAIRQDRVYYALYRDGVTGVCKLQKSADKTIWVDVYTFTFTSTAALYPVIEIYKDPTPALSGKMYHPTLQRSFPGSTPAASQYLNPYATKAVTPNAQTGTTYTLQASDNGGIVYCTNASPITVTVPSGLPTGFNCTIVQGGAGQVTLAASGTTLNNADGYTKTALIHATASILSTPTANTYTTCGRMQ